MSKQILNFKMQKIFKNKVTENLGLMRVKTI